MTLSTTDSSIFYNGNGSLTLFTIPFRFLADGDLEVFLIDSNGVPQLQVLTTDYTLTGAGSGSGGDITFVVAPPTGTDNVQIFRHVDPTQNFDYVENDPFPAESHELGLDSIVMMVQELFERTGGATFDIGNTGFLGLLATDPSKWDAESMIISNVLDPTADQDAATKKYVDDQTTLATGALVSVEGVSNPAGNVDFIAAGGGITIVGDDGANTVTFTVSPASGSILTINTISPTGPGNFIITAGNNITIDADTNGITINATGDVSADATSLQGRALADTAPNPGEVVGWDGGGSTWKPTGGVAILRHKEDAGTDGGTATSGSFNTRTINENLTDPSSLITTLASNQFKLAAGTYRILAFMTSFNIGQSTPRIRNVTDGSTAIVGHAHAHGSSANVASPSVLMGVLTTNGTKFFELQQRPSSTKGTTGFGRAANFGEDEIFMTMEITQLF